MLSSKLGYAKNSGNKALGTKLAGATWGTLMMVPIVAMIVGFVINGISLFSGIVFGVFVVLVVVNFGSHVKDCKECKMRFVCGMSAAKKP